MTLPSAILAMIRAAVPGVTVYDGRSPDGPEPETPPERYAVLYADNGTRAAENVAHESTGAVFRWQVTSVAPDRGMAAWVADRIRDGLLDQRPTVTGWEPGLIEHTFSGQPNADEVVLERPVVVFVDRYVLAAERLI